MGASTKKMEGVNNFPATFREERVAENRARDDDGVLTNYRVGQASGELRT